MEEWNDTKVLGENTVPVPLYPSQIPTDWPGIEPWLPKSQTGDGAMARPERLTQMF
jgi:hypothetical protein